MKCLRPQEVSNLNEAMPGKPCREQPLLESRGLALLSLHQLNGLVDRTFMRVVPLFLTQQAFLNKHNWKKMRGHRSVPKRAVLWSHWTGGTYMLVTSDVYFPARETRRD